MVETHFYCMVTLVNRRTDHAQKPEDATAQSARPHRVICEQEKCQSPMLELTAGTTASQPAYDGFAARIAIDERALSYRNRCGAVDHREVAA